MRGFSILALMGALAAFGLGETAAPAVANPLGVDFASPPSDSSGNCAGPSLFCYGYGGTLGYEFTVGNSAVSVGGLAVFDDGSLSLVNGATVGLWYEILPQRLHPRDQRHRLEPDRDRGRRRWTLGRRGDHAARAGGQFGVDCRRRRPRRISGHLRRRYSHHHRFGNQVRRGSIHHFVDVKLSVAKQWFQGCQRELFRWQYRDQSRPGAHKSVALRGGSRRLRPAAPAQEGLSAFRPGTTGNSAPRASGDRLPPTRHESAAPGALVDHRGVALKPRPSAIMPRPAFTMNSGRISAPRRVKRASFARGTADRHQPLAAERLGPFIGEVGRGCVIREGGRAAAAG